jgi:hypothetical protein
MQTVHVVEKYGQPKEIDRATQDVKYIFCFGKVAYNQFCYTYSPIKIKIKKK